MNQIEKIDNETNKKSLIEEACKIVYLNFGSGTAQLYRAGLKDKADEEILISLEESLAELIGPEKAQLEIKDLKNKA